MDLDQLLIAAANNMILKYSDAKFQGECDLLLYKNACEFLSARFRINALLWNKQADDYENGSTPDST